MLSHLQINQWPTKGHHRELLLYNNSLSTFSTLANQSDSKRCPLTRWCLLSQRNQMRGFALRDSKNALFQSIDAQLDSKARGYNFTPSYRSAGVLIVCQGLPAIKCVFLLIWVPFCKNMISIAAPPMITAGLTQLWKVHLQSKCFGETFFCNITSEFSSSLPNVPNPFSPECHPNFTKLYLLDKMRTHWAERWWHSTSSKSMKVRLTRLKRKYSIWLWYGWAAFAVHTLQLSLTFAPILSWDILWCLSPK